MSKIKNSGLDQYGAGPLERQQFGIAGVEGVNSTTVPYIRVLIFTLVLSSLTTIGYAISLYL